MYRQVKQLDPSNFLLYANSVMLNLHYGIDEAGMGAIAGPAVICGVYANPAVLKGLKDSKSYTQNQREQLFPSVVGSVTGFEIFLITPEEIDRNGLYTAWRKKVAIAIQKLEERFGPNLSFIDGNRSVLPRIISIVDGDKKNSVVAAASIIAKVTRDRLMLLYSDEFPQYEFAKNKGYGTQQHILAIRQFGPCGLHRKSFLKKITGGQQ